jgi:hypothetical protein
VPSAFPACTKLLEEVTKDARSEKYVTECVIGMAVSYGLVWENYAWYVEIKKNVVV